MKTMLGLALMLAAAAATHHGDDGWRRRGDSIMGFSGLAEYQPGTAKMILSAPHGGYMDHPGIADRQHGCYDNNTDTCVFEGDPLCASPEVKKCKIITRGDRYTIELSLIAADEVERILGKRPHLIFSHLQRIKLDPNRDVHQAAQQNRLAEAAYHDFHGFIRRARRAVGRGILFDMHGQCAGHNSTMLGYLVNKEDLNAGDYYADNSSVKAVFSRQEGMTGEEFLAGERSLGALWEGLGYRAVPSPRQPFPGNESYYRGGFITRQHGSLSGLDEVDAIQIETPGELKNDVDESVRRRFGEAMGRAFAEFYTMYYGDGDGANGGSGGSSEEGSLEEEESSEECKEDSDNKESSGESAEKDSSEEMTAGEMGEAVSTLVAEKTD